MIEIDPIQAISIFKPDNIRRNLSVAEYIKSVAKEAEELAVIWEEITKALLLEREITNDKLKELQIHKWIPHNGMPFSKLESFYRNISTALGKNKIGIEYINKVTGHVGSILERREGANTELLEILNEGSIAFFKDTAISENSIENLSRVVATLRKEAADLHVLSQQVAVIE